MLYAGGSFGRRANPQSDYLVEAAHIAKAINAELRSSCSGRAKTTCAPVISDRSTTTSCAQDSMQAGIRPRGITASSVSRF